MSAPSSHGQQWPPKDYEEQNTPFQRLFSAQEMELVEVDYATQQAVDAGREERLKAIEEINALPRNRVDELIEELQKRIDEQLSGPRERLDLGKLQQEAQLLFMLMMRKNSKNDKLLEEYAQYEVKVLADRIKSEHTSWAQLTLAIVGGGLMIIGGFGQMSHLVGVSKDIAKAAGAASTVGQGFKSGDEVMNRLHQGNITVLQAAKENAESKGRNFGADEQDANRTKQTLQEGARQVVDSHEKMVESVASLTNNS